MKKLKKVIDCVLHYKKSYNYIFAFCENRYNVICEQTKPH